jgi:hypothetical protein
MLWSRSGAWVCVPATLDAGSSEAGQYAVGLTPAGDDDRCSS